MRPARCAPARAGSSCPCAATAHRGPAPTARATHDRVRSQRNCGRKRKRPGLGILQTPAGPDSMTLPKQNQGSRYRITACRSNSPRSISVSDKACLQQAIANGREGLATAGRTIVRQINVPLPRVPVNARSTRNGVGRQARVDPSREARAYTAGPTRTVQNGPPGKAPTVAWRTKRCAESTPGKGRGATSAGRATVGPGGESRRHIPPWRVRNGPRGEFCGVVLRTVEITPTPDRRLRAPGQGWGARPQPAH